MAAHSSHQSPMIAPSTALDELLTAHPELTPEASGLTWAVTPAGGIQAEARDTDDEGRALLAAARVLGGTAAISTVSTGRECMAVGELAAVYRGVPVQVWETYTTPERRPLGALVVLPAGGGR